MHTARQSCRLWWATPLDTSSGHAFKASRYTSCLGHNKPWASQMLLPLQIMQPGALRLFLLPLALNCFETGPCEPCTPQGDAYGGACHAGHQYQAQVDMRRLNTPRSAVLCWSRRIPWT